MNDAAIASLFEHNLPTPDTTTNNDKPDETNDKSSETNDASNEITSQK